MASKEIDYSKLLVLEPLYDGCHKRLIDIVLKSWRGCTATSCLDTVRYAHTLPVCTGMFKNSINGMYDTEEELNHILADLCAKKQVGVLNDSYRNICYTFRVL